jgi:choice-of-anchor B domain-containing protein
MSKSTTLRLIATAASIGATLGVVSVLAHDGAGHGSDALPPYDGQGYSAGAGGVPGLEFPAQGVHLLSWIPVVDFGSHVAANDCWGYVSPSQREYAIIGLSHGTGFVDITNPGLPSIVGVIPGPPSDWRDIKTYSHFAYAVTEGSSPAQAIQVIDLSQIDDGVVIHVNTINEGGTVTTTRTHNVAIDEVSGYLYRCGGGGGSIGLRIYSLADPANPMFVGEWHDRYVHDAEIVTYTEDFADHSPLLRGFGGRLVCHSAAVLRRSDLRLWGASPVPIT